MLHSPTPVINLRNEHKIQKKNIAFSDFIRKYRENKEIGKIRYKQEENSIMAIDNTKQKVY